MFSEGEINKEKLKFWYYKERKNINIVFARIMRYCDNNEISFNIDKQLFYDKFVEFIYKYSYLKNSNLYLL